METFAEARSRETAKEGSAEATIGDTETRFMKRVRDRISDVSRSSQKIFYTETVWGTYGSEMCYVAAPVCLWQGALSIDQVVGEVRDRISVVVTW
jgi:hypothetical protein